MDNMLRHMRRQHEADKEARVMAIAVGTPLPGDDDDYDDYKEEGVESGC